MHQRWGRSEGVHQRCAYPRCIPGRAEDYRSEGSPQPGDKRQRTEPGRPSPRVRAPGEEFERGAMKPERRSSGFAGREGCVRERTYFFVADPCIDFRIDVYEADDVALMKVIQYRRQFMWHIDKGSEVQHDVTTKSLRQMSSGTAKAAAGLIAKTKQRSGEQFPAEPRRPPQRRWNGCLGNQRRHCG